MDEPLKFRCHAGHRLGHKRLIAQKRTVAKQSLGTALSRVEKLVSLPRPAAVTQGARKLKRLTLRFSAGGTRRKPFAAFQTPPGNASQAV